MTDSQPNWYNVHYKIFRHHGKPKEDKSGTLYINGEGRPNTLYQLISSDPRRLALIFG